MIELSANQYNLIANVFSFTAAAMAVAAVFFLVQRGEVLPRYRAGIAVLGLVGLVTAYNHVRLLQSWQEAYRVTGAVARATGAAFNDTFRYSAWLLTIPLLLVAFVLVLDLTKQQTRLRCAVLVLLAAEMVVLGFPGQGSTDPATRWMWWGISLVPFALIVVQLYGSLGAAIAAQPLEARKFTATARLAILITLVAYPALYLVPLAGVSPSAALVIKQVGFTVADAVAGGLCAVLVYMVATSKSAPAADAPAAKAPAFRGLKV